MKRLSLFALLATGMTLLAGCPIFDDGPGSQCWDNNCGAGGGPTTTTTNTPLPGSCFSQAECGGVNETCGSDGFCHTGDCTLWGCVSGQQCIVGADQKAHCGDTVTQGGAGGTGGVTNAGGTGGVTNAGGTGGAGGVTNAGGTGGAGGSTSTAGAGGAGGSTSTAGAGGAGGSTSTAGAGGSTGTAGAAGGP